MTTATVCVSLLACGSRSDLDFIDFGGNDSDGAIGGGFDAAAGRDGENGGDATSRDAHAGEDGSSSRDASTVDAGFFGWPRTWGGSGSEIVRGLAVGADGSVVVVGEFQGTVDFDPGPGVDERIANGTDAFVVKLAGDGAYLWADTWGGPPSSFRDDDVARVATTADGSILVAGTFATTVDFDPGPGTDEHTPAGNDFSAYVTKLDADGGHLWSRTWGSGGRTSAWGLGAASDGSVFVGGAFDLTVDLDPGAGVDDHTSNGDLDVYVTKLDANGAFVWGRAWGGSGTEENAGMLGVDGAGAVVVGGSFQSTVDFDPGPGVDDRAAAGTWDLFALKLDSSGTRSWARTIGDASGAELGYQLATATDGSIAITGVFYGAVDFDPTSGVDVHSPGAQYDAFVLRLASDGSYVWTRTFGGATAAARTEGAAVTFDPLGRVVVGGSFFETIDFDPGAGVVSRTAAGTDSENGDMYALRFTSGGDFDAVRTWGGVGPDYVFGVEANAASAIYVAGSFSDVVDLSTSGAPDSRTSHGSLDAFALEWLP